ncbi:MAG: hypothetical protein JNK82_42730, partial [Myxococcaceae bacterium]|nr:hypothetical protein [Myxococcaceae bacterium]
MVAALSLLVLTAAGDERRATALYEEGLKFYNVSDYGHAIEKFKAAYLLVEAPELLYNIAQAYRLWGGHCEGALQSYRSFLRAQPSSPRRAKVEQHIAELQKCLEPAPPPEAPAPIVIVKVREKRLVRPWVGPVVMGAAGVALAISGAALLGWVQRDWGRF